MPPRQVMYEVYTSKDDVSGYLSGTMKGSRWVKMVIQGGVSVPVSHWLVGRRIRIEVQGRRECVFCLKPLKDCPGKGNKKECKKVTQVAASWSERLKKFQGLCNGGAGWQEGAEDLEATMQRIRRDEASPEDLNRTLDPVL